MDSLEVTTVTAPLTSPMLNLAVTRLANKACEGLGDLALMVFLGAGSTATEPETNASSLLLIKVACDVCFVPPLLEPPRPSLAKPKKFLQAGSWSSFFAFVSLFSSVL